MKRFLATALALVAGACLALAQPNDGTTPATSTGTASTAKPKPLRSAAATALALQQMQGSLDELTKSNHDLLDLLKQQQQVLEDIQFDRRLQSRQISTLEERLEEALAEKQQLQEKVDSLEMQVSTHPVLAPAPPTPASAPDTAVTTGVAPTKPTVATITPITMPTVTSVDTPDTKAPAAVAPPPATYLPPEGADNPPGVQQWHRLLTLKGTDNLQTDVFTVHGRMWRVLWHNQDKPGKLYANTSALFINAFPRDDTIPMKVSSKLGSGGDATQLQGPGNYYLKIEASGGSWELAVEDFR
jgi:hypothetical protein